jgi:hypothetical protein
VINLYVLHHYDAEWDHYLQALIVFIVHRTQSLPGSCSRYDPQHCGVPWQSIVHVLTQLLIYRRAQMMWFHSQT